MFPSKHQTVYTVDLFMTELVQNETFDSKELELKIENRREFLQTRHQFQQPDFTITLFNGTLKYLNMIIYKANFFTRSALLLFELTEREIYHVDIARAKFSGTNINNDNLNELDEFTVVVSTVILKIHMKNINMTAGLTVQINANNFPFNNRLKSINCPMERKRFKQTLNWLAKGWFTCAKEIIQTKFNCTDFCLLKSITKQFIQKNQQSAIAKEFFLSNGYDFYEVKYTIFYATTKSRNMFTLLAPFTFYEWAVILISFYFTGFVLWLSFIKYIPFFWLFTVFLEQNDDNRKGRTKHNFHLIAWWLYAVFLLRNFYTSNLYT